MIANIETRQASGSRSSKEKEQERTVLIIGGAAGVGRVTAQLLARRGLRVFITAGSKQELGAAITDLCQWGMEVYGMVVDWSSSEGVRKLFDEAERQLGQVHVVVNLLDLLTCADPEICQNLCTEEAIFRMQSRGKGHIINVRLPGKPAHKKNKFYPAERNTIRGISAALRRQANELGIRVTLIKHNVHSTRQPARASQALFPEDIASCVHASIMESSGVDVVFLQGQYQPQMI